MHLESYELIYGDSFSSFSFISEGKKGRIRKVIQFQKFSYPNIYNLAFGDENVQTKELNDLVVTNNGDTEKVLATVVKSIYFFTNEEPNMWIYMTGSTAARTRLYQIGINRFLDLLFEDFEIYGELESG